MQNTCPFHCVINLTILFRNKYEYLKWPEGKNYLEITNRMDFRGTSSFLAFHFHRLFFV
jgi:hypothetical protein